MIKEITISATADLHGHLPQLQAADLAVVCGDIFPGGLDDIRNESYPAMLGKLMGSSFEVKSFGRRGAGLWEGGAFPYTSTIEYFRAIDYDADVYVICLGTNDLVQTIDNKFIKAFKEDYEKLVQTIHERAVAYAIFLATIPPVPALFKPGEEEAVKKINRAIAAVAKETGSILIDLNKAFGDNADLFSDGVHPNPDGARLLAETVYMAFSKTLPKKPRIQLGEDL